jgi:hypothetical protein
VGVYTNVTGSSEQTLIEHWNGKTWKVISSPSPGIITSWLNGVAAVSATNTWAVGFINSISGAQTLIEHWNGKTWKVVSSPNPGTYSNELNGVAALSATNIWAVGFDFNTNRTPLQTLVEHWNGKTWQIVPSPNVGTGDNSLNGMAMGSSTHLWVVGNYQKSSGTNNQTLTETRG